MGQFCTWRSTKLCGESFKWRFPVMLFHQCAVEEICSCKNTLWPHFFRDICGNPNAMRLCLKHPPRTFSRTILFWRISGRILKHDSNLLYPAFDVITYPMLLVCTKGCNSAGVSSFGHVDKELDNC